MKNQAKRKPETVPEPELSDEIEPVRARNAAEETCREFLDQFEDVYSVSIWKLDGTSGRWTFKGTASHDVVTEEYIQHTYRGGQYKLQARSHKGLLATKSQIHIDDPVEENRPELAAVPAAAPALDLYAVMQANSQRQHEMLIALISRPQPSTNLADMVPLLKLMQGSPQTTLADQLETLKSLRELMTADNDSSTSVDIMKELRSVLVPILAARFAGRMGGTVAEKKLSARPTSEPISAEMEEVILRAIGTVKPAALAGVDPIAMARVAITYAQTDPEAMEFLSELSEQRFPQALALLGQFDAELTRDPLASWLGIFHEALNDELHRAEHSERDPGNAGNAARYGAAGAGSSTPANNAGGLDGRARPVE